MKFVLICLCIFGLAYADDEHGKFVVSMNKESFSSAIAEKPHFVMFFAPWCGHCKRLAPDWDKLAEKWNVEGGSATVGKVDCTVDTALCSEQGVTGYPTLQFYQGRTADQYGGGRQFEELDLYLTERVKESGDGGSAVPAETDTLLIQDGLATLTDKTFDQAIEKGFAFVKFYAPWCGHCKRLAPTWDLLAKEFAHEEDITIAKIDCTEHRTACGKYEIQGYPTLMWFADGKKVEKYGMGRELDSLKQYVKEQKNKVNGDKEGTEGKVPETEDTEPTKEGNTYVLTGSTFEDTVKTGFTFVKFYAPWCGHCKKMAPTWAELGDKFADHKTVKIAKVDCTQHRDLCSKHNVRGFPTLLLFKDGAQLEEHNGARDLESLHNMITSKLSHDEL